MKARTISYGVMLFPLLCAVALPARAQAASSQQTLNRYVADLQSNPNDTALRGKIIGLAQTMRPAPAIPEEARGHYVMAATFAEKAKSDTERAKDSSDLKLASAGFERAVAEYKAASLAAPWWADAYKKLAIAQKAAQQYDDAIASLNLYLLTQPADARDAQDEIYKLKALKQSVADDQANQARRQQEEQQRTYEASPEGQFQSLLRKIDGRRYIIPQTFAGRRYVLDVRGKVLVWGEFINGDYSVREKIGIQGRETTEYYENGGHTVWLISDDGNTITESGVIPGGPTNVFTYVWQR